MKKKICILTGTRADYGLFYPLLTELKKESQLKLQIIATGMHLSPEYGLTYKVIEKDGFLINEKVEILLSSDTDTGISKSIGLGIIGFADTFEKLKPDMVIVLGDRFETFAATTSAFIAKIPIGHIHGGEITEGAIDDALRHSITKMSYLHFTSTEEYRTRIIQLGEAPERVFNVGALGLDNIKNLKLLRKKELEKKLNFNFKKNTALITYHPVTMEKNTSKLHIKELLKALDKTKNLKLIFTRPNADAGGRVIIRLIDDYVKNRQDKAVVFTSLGQLKYLSTLKYVDIIIGNSSSGIIEAPSFKKPVVNIGDRQKGRIKAESIISCKAKEENITKAIQKGLSKDFKEICKKADNPYGKGNSTEKIIKVIKKEIYKISNVKKTFYNINFQTLL